MKKAIFLPFLLISPLLFMANSPAPYADFTHEISPEDYQINNLGYGSKETMGDLELYPFTIDIQNNSEYFLSYWSLDIIPNTDQYIDGIQAFKILTPYYDEECIKPGETLTVSGYALEQYPLEELNKGRGYGYSADGVLAEYESVVLVHKYIDYTSSQYYKKTCQYDLRFTNLTYEQQSGYQYSAIIEYSLNDHTHYHFERYLSDSLSIYSFEDAETIEIKSVSVIGEPYHYYHWNLDGFFKSLGVVCLIFLGVIAGIGWVVSSIIVLVKQPWRRKSED